MGKFFGTDGIRGIANSELTCELAMKIGKATAKFLASNGKNNAKILIGKDTRISSDMLESALFAGICSSGVTVVSLGVVPTPAVSHLVRKYNADAGIMISASHNSFEFNGIKLFDKNGLKLPDDAEKEIENLIINDSNDNLPIGEKIGRITYIDSAVIDYVEFISSIGKNIDKNLKIAVDCANGSASATAKMLFEKLGLKADLLFIEPNGVNINNNCGSTYLESLTKYVTKNKCDIGIAFDGDADRCLFIDEKGKIIDGDCILAICAQHMKKQNKLKNNALVGTIMSNLGLKKFCEQNDIKFLETKVGDRYVLEKMRQENYSLGGEQSGHIIFAEHMPTGDGQLTAVQILNILSSSEKKASELNSIVKKYPQKSATVDISANQKGVIGKNKTVSDYLSCAQKKLAGYGRIVVRESGTEPKIRIMVEHENENALQNLLDQTVKVIYENLN